MTGAAELDRRAVWIGDGPALLPRPRVDERLQAALHAPLVALTAPAGHGKSTALRQWAAAHPGVAVVTLRLQPDDDRRRIVRRLITAVAAHGPDLDVPTVLRLQEDLSSHDRSVVRRVVAELGRHGPAVLVLDGLDAVEDQAAVGDLLSVCDLRPPGLRIVVTRRTHDSALARACPSDAAAHLTAEDLAFTRDEAAALVELVAGRELTASQLDLLMTRTEGWPVAVQLAAISLRRPGDADEVLASLTGVQPHVAAFLTGELLAGVPARARQFLVRTSVLETLDGPRCDHLSGGRASAVTLRLLERRGLLARRPSTAIPTFVHHPLLRDLLRHELRVTDPGSEAHLLRRAATWHTRRGEPQAAARYLVEAEDWDGLVALADRFGRTLFERGEPTQLLGWLEAVPANAPNARGVALRRAYVLSMLGQSRRAEQIVHGLPPGTLTRGERLIVDSLRATWAFVDATPGSSIGAADAVLAAVDDVDPDTIPDLLGLTTPSSLRVMAAGSRARALWYTGDIDASRASLTELVSQLDVYPPWLAHTRSALAILEAWEGNLRRASHHARRALLVAASAGLRLHPAVSDSYLAIAHVLRERGELRRADELLEEAHQIATRTRRPMTVVIHAVESALWHLAAGSPDQGLAVIEQHRAMGEPPPPPVIERRLRAAELRLLLATGRVDAARSALRHLGAHRSPEISSAAIATWIAVGDLGEAAAELDAWAPDRGGERARLERAFWTAVLELETGQRRLALRRCQAVVEASRGDGHVALFRDAGAPGQRLLRAFAHAAPGPHLDMLLAAAEDVPERGDDATRWALTDRELEVVRYLPTPLSNSEIAARLFISLNTLKTHLRTVYRKLGVQDRRDAIRRAEELGIA